MQKSISISVIIPTYNRANTILRAVDSVLNQSFKNVELIVIDDGSTDNTLDLLAEYKLKVLSQNNLGVSSARNLGVKHASYDWIAFLDSDDQWHRDKLAEQVKFLLENKVHLVHTNEQWIRNNVKVNPPKKYNKGGGDQFIPCLKLCAIGPSTVLMEKRIFLELGGFREDFQCCEDYDLWLKYTSLYDVGYIDKLLINKYGGHEDQLSSRFVAMDFWRVCSMDWILKNRDLERDKKSEVLKVLKKKCEILIKGYKKHSNLENLGTVQDIYRLYFVS